MAVAGASRRAETPHFPPLLFLIVEQHLK